MTIHNCTWPDLHDAGPMLAFILATHTSRQSQTAGGRARWLMIPAAGRQSCAQRSDRRGSSARETAWPGSITAMSVTSQAEKNNVWGTQPCRCLLLDSEF
eukprot:655743-Rhodomonas_salina.2